MAIKFGYMPKSSYTKIDNNVSRIKDLSGNAAKLYMFIAGMQNGKNITDAYIHKALGYSKNSITKYKNELKKYNLLKTQHIGHNSYYMFIGNTTIGADTVMSHIKNDDIDILTLEELEKRHNQTKDLTLTLKDSIDI